MYYERHAKLLTAIFAALWLALAIKPVSRMDWILENVLLVLALPIFIAAYRHHLFSRLSHTLIFAFMCLHQIGAQGDIWDAHKDMALASLGALIAMLITAAVNYKCQRDFAREWSDSWRIRAGNPDFTDGTPRG